MKIFLVILIIAILVIFYPFVNWFMTQVVFKSKKRTRKMLLRGYHFNKGENPNASEKELCLHTMQSSFCILRRQEYPQKPYDTKPKSILTEDDVDEMVEKSTNVENLIGIVIKKGLSPDMAPWF